MELQLEHQSLKHWVLLLASTQATAVPRVTSRWHVCPRTCTGFQGLSQVAQKVKIAGNAGDGDKTWVPTLGREDIVGGRKWQPNPVFLPEESHGPRSLVGYSPQRRKEEERTERTEHA